MDPTFPISVGLSALATWAICYYAFGAARRRCLRDTTAQLKQSMNLEDQRSATQAMLYLSALRALESGDSESAKRDLALGAATFYHRFSGSEQQSSWIEAQKREVEVHSKTSVVLRAALEATDKPLKVQKPTEPEPERHTNRLSDKPSQRDLITSQAEAIKFDQFAAEMEQTGLLLDASHALTDLDFLTRMEEKRYDDVTALLVHKLGLFYYEWNAKPDSDAHSEHIQNALAQIREAAKYFKSIEPVLAYKPGNERLTD